MRGSLKASIVLGCSLAAGAIHAFAGNTDPAIVRKAFERATRSITTNADNSAYSEQFRQSNAASAKLSPLAAFSMQGSGTQLSVKDGTCSGAMCSASLGDCQCAKYQGTLNATSIGKANWTASVTLNADDCTNTGTPSGICCFGDGVLSATDNTKAANTLSMSFTGPVCFDPNASMDMSVSGTFIILPAGSTGKFALSTGTGQINVFSLATDGTSYLAGDGLIQVVSPLPTPTATATP